MRQNIKTWLCILIPAMLATCPGCRKGSAFLKTPKPEFTIGPDDSRLTVANIHLSKDTVYVLAVNLVRDSAQILSIDAGTIIKVNDKRSVTIRPGGRIEARGTSSLPIIFTSSASTGGVGQIVNNGGNSDDLHFWYGLRIYGNSDKDPNSASGFLNYVRIEFAGGSENYSGSPSLLLENVGKGTVLENIQVSYSFQTPSFEFFGGSFQADGLLSYASGGTDFYIHQGYTGMLQHLLAYRHPFFASPSIANGNLAGLLLEDSLTLPVISNLTVLGPDAQVGTNANYNLLFRVASLVTTGGARFHIRNSVFLGFPKGGWYLDDKRTALSVANGLSDFTYSIVHANDSSRAFYLAPGVYQQFTSVDFKNYMLAPNYNNLLFLSSTAFMLTDPFNYDLDPRPSPLSGSPLLRGTNFDGVFSDAFFKKVDYRGAIGPEDWMNGWTNFLPLRTNYNN